MSLCLAGIYLEIFRKWEDLQCVYVCVCVCVCVCHVLWYNTCVCPIHVRMRVQRAMCQGVCMYVCVCVCAHATYTVEPPL